MCFKSKTLTSTNAYWAGLNQLKHWLEQTDAIVIGAGAGLSVAAGFTYDGERFTQNFADFQKQYGITDMYAGGFYPYGTPEEYWGWWSRHIYLNRYVDAPKTVYRQLLNLVKEKDYFVLTTNVDHQFQKAGFDKKRLFYTQGDYGLWQCSKPCHQQTYDNEEAVRRMLATQKDRKIPTTLLPKCPVCGGPMTMNLRCDQTFVEDEGWRQACCCYEDFLRRHQGLPTLFWELGVGENTPAIIKYPFWQMTAANQQAVYACVNIGQPLCPPALAHRAICLQADISQVLEQLCQ